MSTEPRFTPLDSTLFEDGQVPSFDADTGTFSGVDLPSSDSDASLFNFATGGTATASITGGGSPANGFDGDPATYWATGNVPLGQWIQYDRGAGREMPLIAYAIVTNGNAADTPTDFNIQGSNDGNSWTTLDTRSGQLGLTKLAGPYPIVDTTPWRFIRLTITATLYTGNAGTVFELMLIGGEPSVLSRFLNSICKRFESIPKGITVSTADGATQNSVTELRLPAGTLTVVSPGVVQWAPSAGGYTDG